MSQLSINELSAIATEGANELSTSVTEGADIQSSTPVKHLEVHVFESLEENRSGDEKLKSMC